jgi:hypothetical protein
LPRAEAEHGQRHARGALLLDMRSSSASLDVADVEVAVGGEHHAVVAAALVALARHAVGEPEPLAAGRRAARLEPLDGLGDARLLRARRGRQHHPALPRVHDERDAVLRAELVDEQPQRALDERQLVVALHRARDVDEEDEVVRRQPLDRDGSRLQRDAHEAVPRLPRRRRHLGVDGDRRVAGGGGEGVREVVDQLLEAHRVGRRARALRQEAAHVAVRRAVHVHREGRARVARDGEERVVLDAVVLLAVGRRHVAADGSPGPSRGAARRDRRPAGERRPDHRGHGRRRRGGDAGRGRRVGRARRGGAPHAALAHRALAGDGDLVQLERRALQREVEARGAAAQHDGASLGRVPDVPRRHLDRGAGERVVDGQAIAAVVRRLCTAHGPGGAAHDDAHPDERRPRRVAHGAGELDGRARGGGAGSCEGGGAVRRRGGRGTQGEGRGEGGAGEDERHASSGARAGDRRSAAHPRSHTGDVARARACTPAPRAPAATACSPRRRRA